MTNPCCSKPASDQPLRSAPCPQCGQRAMPVAAITLLHHVRQPWNFPISEGWRVCENPQCPWVYFKDERHIGIDTVRDLPARKNTATNAPVCFCFGITRDQATDPAIRRFVTERTREGRCDCKIRNPAGRCCLKDFPKPTG